MTEQEQADMLNDAMDTQNITDNSLRAGIAAIAMGESGFQMKPEMGYARTNNHRIRMIFGTRVANYDDNQLDALKANPEAFFNVVYGGPFGERQLGNTQPGDGFKFRGRGLFQLTGRGNYDRYGKMVGVDLLADPDAADDPKTACALAVAYMKDRYRGGGWSAMKRAVGYNVPDIAAAKDQLYTQYTQSGEFDA